MFIIWSKREFFIFCIRSGFEMAYHLQKRGTEIRKIILWMSVPNWKIFSLTLVQYFLSYIFVSTGCSSKLYFKKTSSWQCKLQVEFISNNFRNSKLKMLMKFEIGSYIMWLRTRLIQVQNFSFVLRYSKVFKINPFLLNSITTFGFYFEHKEWNTEFIGWQYLHGKLHQK